MAKDKKSFILYCDQRHIFNELSNEEAGMLIKHIFSYTADENPEPESRLIKIAFEPIKHQLKRDLIKYETVRERNSSNAKKRWDAKNATACDRIPKHAKNADTDNGNVTVNVTDTVKREVYTPAHDLELPEMKISSAIEYLTITKNIQATKELVISLWNFFKQKNFAGPKIYRSESDAYSHFFETLKFEKLEPHINGHSKNGKLGTSEARIKAAKNWGR